MFFLPYNNAKLLYVYHQDYMLKSGHLNQALKSIADSARYIIKDRGFLELWRNDRALIYCNTLGFQFALNHIFLSIIRANQNTFNRTINSVDSLLAGSLAGFTYKLISYPFFFANDLYLKDQRSTRFSGTVKNLSFFEFCKKTF